mmetsp:Transcript_20440/g.82576  ORF Transcript_20440/g.82576 Transcript_20440/m.82576 type:complete len:435 (+) Transcript_20440:718-2022(+)
MIYELYLSKYEERVSKNGDNFLEDFEKHLVKERQEEKAKLATEAAVVDLTCHKCESGKDDEQLLICDSCETGWHMFCMTPPMKRLPPEDELWFCPNCDPGAGKEFGFDVGEDFSLEEFKEYATAIRNNWFHDLGREPTIDEIEEQYWKISGEAERLVYIPYGSDLDTREVGSGFPNPRNEKHSGGEYDEYLRCPWNLNIFPELNGSLLSYLTESIKGVTVPWLYLGMIFSSFCYHTEDSYMYSINYHHFGAPKIWYGTSGGKGAAHFEAAMRSAAPKLFDANPGLFYHLTTMVSPIDLMNRGAKVVRAVQNPGEFVMTFPQAYHGGFSTGFNCGEAVRIPENHVVSANETLLRGTAAISTQCFCSQVRTWLCRSISLPRTGFHSAAQPQQGIKYTNGSPYFATRKSFFEPSSHRTSREKLSHGTQSSSTLSSRM